jgi:hypothetical protein
MPNTTDSYAAGTQIVLNHNNNWQGCLQNCTTCDWMLEHGGKPVITSGIHILYRFYYYNPKGSLATFDGLSLQGYLVD